MATKFSQFTAGATTANTLVVGFDSNLNTNNKYTLSQLGAGLASFIPTFYSLDGSLPADATRTVTMPGTANIIFTGGTDNSIQIGDLSAANGIGWKITPGTGGASASMTIADTNGKNIIFKYANGNNPIAKTRVVALGEQNSGYTGKATVAINQPGNYWANAPWLNQNNTDNSALWIWGGGNKYTATLIGKYGGANGTTNPDPGSDDDKIIQCMAWPGTTANSRLQRIFAASTSGLVEIGSASNGAIYKAATNLKVNGQAYTVFHQPSTAITDLTIDWNNSNIQEVTLAASSPTFTASNPKVGATYILTIKQTGAVTPTWTGVKWPADTPPTLSGAGKTDVITLICYDETGAGLYYGASTLNFTT